MKDPWQVTSTLNSRLNFRLVICDLQSLGHDPIVVSTKPAAGHDINLCGEMAYPVADALPAGSVPFIFVTGYDCATIPMCYVRVPDCENPINLEQIARTMFG